MNFSFITEKSDMVLRLRMESIVDLRGQISELVEGNSLLTRVSQRLVSVDVCSFSSVFRVIVSAVVAVNS